MKRFKLDFTMINKVLIAVLMMVALFMSTFYEPLGNEVLDSLGEYEDSIYYMDGAWMDFTEYGKINYPLVNTRENEYFEKIFEGNECIVYERYRVYF